MSDNGVRYDAIKSAMEAFPLLPDSVEKLGIARFLGR
jgi:hypothetical protein